ncbi:MAG: hypothetical protein KAY37_01860 [Phycisphaerae bacterium]|nr:hypothetical protein [Phycisphaerae bacterium]
MSTTLGVPAALAEKVMEFIRAKTLPLEVVAEGSGTIQVVQSEGRQQSDPSTLQAGGWIACEDAFAAASKLAIPTQTMGKLLNTLDIRMRSCQLGCF